MTELCQLPPLPVPLRVEDYSGPQPLAESPRVAVASRVQKPEQDQK